MLTLYVPRTYPIETDVLLAVGYQGFPPQFASAEDLLKTIEPMIVDFEVKLKSAQTFV